MRNDLPLSGVRVIDLTTVVAGPSASQTLADYGADVIKVEAPGGDTTRHTGPMLEPGMASLFLGSNRNKRSIVLETLAPPTIATTGRVGLPRPFSSASSSSCMVRPA